MIIKEPNYVERLARASGLTWPGLASRLSVDERGRPGLRIPAGPGQRRESSGNGRPDSEGQGG